MIKGRTATSSAVGANMPNIINSASYRRGWKDFQNILLDALDEAEKDKRIERLKKAVEELKSYWVCPEAIGKLDFTPLPETAKNIEVVSKKEVLELLNRKEAKT